MRRARVALAEGDVEGARGHLARAGFHAELLDVARGSTSRREALSRLHAALGSLEHERAR